MNIQRNKVVIIGAGHVGSTILYTLLSSSSIAEIVMIDINKTKAYGEALDGSHATSFEYSPNIQVRQGDYTDCADAGIIIMTAGPSAKPGEKPDRIALGKTNIKVTETVIGEIVKYTQSALILFVSNPVDILTHHATKIATQKHGYPKEKIFGTGTLLDTARFRRIIGDHYLVDTKNVHGYILGEHGGTAFATWSNINIAGVPFNALSDTFTQEPIDLDATVEKVKSVGHDVLLSKGYTNFGIAKSVERIVHCVFSNELSIMPLSSTIDGLYGISDIALSVPCILTKDGIGQQLEIPLSDDEVKLLQHSASFLSDVYKKLTI